MAGLLDLLNSDIGKTIINGVSLETGQPTDKTSNVLSMALPVLTQAMQRNASSSQGAEGLLNALNKKHDGSILDNLGGLFNGGVDSSVTDDGGKILNHILGKKQQNVQNALSKQSGINAGAIGNILKVAAPLLMGLLGKQSRQQNVNNPNDLTGMLGGLLSGENKTQQDQSFLSSILDADGDGSVIDDVAGMVMGNNKKKGGLGGILGGLFGGK
ncbi:DUF937 domain-containing protein [Flavobacteriaceae bacterium AU392]|nr:DUF937 domain-containing protein [Flavobacteriaceae bacterium]RKM85514.1 DUF937 domain-containing protein [Flavobacteriaceae bacterium AU392]